MLFRNIPHNVALAMIAFAIAVMLLAFVSYIIKFACLLKSDGQSEK